MSTLTTSKKQMRLHHPLWMDILLSISKKDMNIFKVSLDVKACYAHTLKTVRYMEELGILKLEKHGRENRAVILDRELVMSVYKILSISSKREREYDRLTSTN